MWIYHLVFILALLLCVYSWIKERKIPFLFFSIFLILIVGFREIGVDNDSKMYNEIFDYYKNHTILEYNHKIIEIGYAFLNKLIYLIGGNVYIVFFLMATFTGIANYLFFYKHTHYPFFSLLFYLSFFLIYRDFNQIRYALACAFCFWATFYFIKEKWLIAISFLTLGILFHNTIVLFVPFLFFLKKFEITKVFLFLLLPCFVIGQLFDVLHIILGYLTQFNKSADFYYNNDGGSSNSITILSLIILVLYYFFHRKNNPTDLFYMKLIMITVLINLLFIQSSISQRLTSLFFQFSIPLLSSILFQMSENGFLKIKKTVYFLFVGFFFAYGTNMIQVDLLRPYKFNSFVVNLFLNK